MKVPDAVEEKLRALPPEPGVYLFLGAGGRVLYVGKAVDLRARVRSYFVGDGPEDRPRIRALLDDVADLDTIRTKTGPEALLLENSLIKKHRPPGNVRLRDDKNYLCVRLDRRHPFPRIQFVRKFERDGAMYFGPYSSAKGVRESVTAITAAFGLRVCSDHVLSSRKRPCLYHEIGRCSAPCVGLIGEAEYARDVEKALEALRGRTAEVERALVGKMERHSERLEFEKAAEIRDRIRFLRQTAERQSVSLSDLKARDVVHLSRRGADLLFLVLFIREGKLVSSRHHFIRSDAELPEAMGSFLAQFYAEGKAVPPEILLSVEPEARELIEGWLTDVRGGRVALRTPARGPARALVRLAAENSDAAAKREEAGSRDRSRFALDALAERLDLSRVPTRIECYDISTIQGAATVASLVSFEDGMPDRAGYRRYRIRTVPGQDDFASMREVMTRRFRRAGEMPVPDLVIVDGGKGQLSAALAALAELDVVELAIAGLAKARAGESGVRARERLFLPGRSDPIVLEPDEPETLLVARIRDEAHRFAITYHRKVRSQLAVSSLLDRIEGVGEVWRTRLLRRFGSVEGIRQASLEELLLVPGLPRETAKRIHAYLAAEGGET